MAFVTGLFLIDAPASALNNAGAVPGEREDNTSGVKVIRTKEGMYPYVSAQAYRYWLRTTLEKQVSAWRAAPVYREEKIAYTDANPLLWWDDDLFGYMRAPSKRESAKAKREADISREGETETLETISRVTPFRVSSLVSLAPVSIINDFGTMTRFEGYPVPYEHQFYRTTLKGLYSLDLASAGTFTYRNRSGYRNLDDVRIRQAETIEGIEHLISEKAYRLPRQMRLARVRALFEGMALIEGGAKQSIHYTDVAPSVILFAVTAGGNHIFNHVFGPNKLGLPEFKKDALYETLSVNSDQLLSPLYIGWTRGYLDEERAKLEKLLSEEGSEIQQRVLLAHPRTVFEHLIEHFSDTANNSSWLQ
jgi:CRISPR-associated protein Cst2